MAAVGADDFAEEALTGILRVAATDGLHLCEASGLVENGIFSLSRYAGGKDRGGNSEVLLHVSSWHCCPFLVHRTGQKPRHQQLSIFPALAQKDITEVTESNAAKCTFV